MKKLTITLLVLSLSLSLFVFAACPSDTPIRAETKEQVIEILLPELEQHGFRVRRYGFHSGSPTSNQHRVEGGGGESLSIDNSFPSGLDTFSAPFNLYKVICDEFLEEIKVNSRLPIRSGEAFVNGRFVLARTAFNLSLNCNEALENIRIIFMNIPT